MRGSRGRGTAGTRERPASAAAGARLDSAATAALITPFAVPGRGRGSPLVKSRFPDLPSAAAAAAAPGAATAPTYSTVRGRGGGRGRVARGSPAVAARAAAAASAPRGGGGGGAAIAPAGLTLAQVENAGALAAQLRDDVAAGAAPDFIVRGLAVVEGHGAEMCRPPGPPLWARRFVDAGGAVAILAAMRVYARNALVVRRACQALHELIGPHGAVPGLPKPVEEVAASGATTSVLSAARAHAGSEDVCAAAFDVLTDLLKCDAAAAVTADAAAGGAARFITDSIAGVVASGYGASGALLLRAACAALAALGRCGGIDAALAPRAWRAAAGLIHVAPRGSVWSNAGAAGESPPRAEPIPWDSWRVVEAACSVLEVIEAPGPGAGGGAAADAGGIDIEGVALTLIAFLHRFTASASWAPEPHVAGQNVVGEWARRRLVRVDPLLRHALALLRVPGALRRAPLAEAATRAIAFATAYPDNYEAGDLAARMEDAVLLCDAARAHTGTTMYCVIEALGAVARDYPRGADVMLGQTYGARLDVLGLACVGGGYYSGYDAMACVVTTLIARLLMQGAVDVVVPALREHVAVVAVVLGALRAHGGREVVVAVNALAALATIARVAPAAIASRRCARRASRRSACACVGRTRGSRTSSAPRARSGARCCSG